MPADILKAWRFLGTRAKSARTRIGRNVWPRLPVKSVGEFEHRINGDLPKQRLLDAVRAVKEKLAAQLKEIATRAASEFALESLIPAIPEMIGGSADLTGLEQHADQGMKTITAADFSGRFIHYGVREHVMAGAMNGLALHGGIIPYSGTFLVFSDYCRPAIRLAALMGLRVIHVMTHDSIGLGEDGPTHQPVEHLAALRAIPNLLVFRPCDAVETVGAGSSPSKARRPSILRSRDRTCPSCVTGLTKRMSAPRGAYEIAAPDGRADVAIFATGSEVAVAVEAARLLAARGIAARVVSVPCFELFLEQKEEYRRALIGDERVKVGVEAAVRRRLGRNHRFRWRFRRHDFFRGERALQGTVQEVRDYRRRGRPRGVGQAWEDVTKAYICRKFVSRRTEIAGSDVHDSTRCH